MLDAIYWFLMLFTSGDCDRLAAESWDAREGAGRRLRLLGPLAVPELLRHAADGDPERRERVRVLLVPYRRWCADLAAAAVLLDPWPVDAHALYRDRPLRERLKRIATAAGCQWCDASALVPDDEWNEWLRDWAKWVVAANALDACREKLGAVPPWWMR